MEQRKIFAIPPQEKVSSSLKILWEALLILVKNWKPLLPITFLTYLFSWLLFVFYSLSFNPLLTDLVRNLASLSKVKPPNPDFYRQLNDIISEMREITAIGATLRFTVFIISTFLLTATINLLYMAHAEKQITLEELLLRVRKTWKGTMYTNFFVSIFRLTNSLLTFLVLGSLMFLSVNSFVFLLVSSVASILAVILCLYLALIWSLSMVVAVVEEGCCGLAAIVRAAEIMKGRRRQGVRITFLIAVVSFGISLVYFVVASRPIASVTVKWLFDGAYLAAMALTVVLENAVIMVFYCECKLSCRGRVDHSTGGFAYSSLPGALIDPAIP